MKPPGPDGQRSLGNLIASRLRDDILLGRLTPGTPLTQPAVSQIYGTSRMPARDALRQLISEGLLVEVAGGAVVARFTIADLEDAHALMAFAHGQAARRAAYNATYDQLTELANLQQAMETAHREGDGASLVEHNWRFHELVNQASRSPKVLAVIRSVAMAMPREYLAAFPELVPALNADKAAIVAALKNRDGDSAAALMQAHVLRGGANLISYFAEKGLISTSGGPVPPLPSADLSRS